MNEAILLLFLLAFTIHNLEEGIWLTRQQSSEKSKVKMHKKVTQDEFLFGLFWVTSLAYLITALYIFYPEVGLFKFAYFGFVGAMILNILFPHLISTLIERYYSPGLFTCFVVIILFSCLIFIIFFVCIILVYKLSLFNYCFVYFLPRSWIVQICLFWIRWCNDIEYTFSASYLNSD